MSKSNNAPSTQIAKHCRTCGQPGYFVPGANQCVRCQGIDYAVARGSESGINLAVDRDPHRRPRKTVG